MLLVVIGLLAYPFGNALYLSLTKKTLGLPAEFIGLGNYIELLTDDPRFMRVAWNSLVYTVFGVAGKLLLGMIMALVLNAEVAKDPVLSAVEG